MLVLPWHFRSEILKREINFINKGGSLIFPLPNVHIVNKKNIKFYAKKINKNSKIFLAGHNGLVGSAIYRKLKFYGYKNVVVKTKRN